MKETIKELPNFSIGIDLLGPYPTSNKNKAEKKLASCTFRKFVGGRAAANFGRKTFTGNKKGDQLVICKISAFIVVLTLFNLGNKVHGC